MADRRAELEAALEAAVVALDAAYATAREDVWRRVERDYCPGTLPEQVVDQFGRYVLLDALTALVSARAALVDAELSNQ